MGGAALQKFTLLPRSKPLSCLSESARKFKSMISPQDMSRNLISMDTRVVRMEARKGHSERP